MKPRILIVDDQPHFARLLRLMLETTGQFEVRELNRPLEVMDASRHFQPDLVILDMEMPGKNGAELARELTRNEARANASIVFLSGLIAPGESGLKPTPQGPMRFLSKTNAPHQTLQAIQDALSDLKVAV